MIGPETEPPAGADAATLAFYDREAESYAAYLGTKADQVWLVRFAQSLPPGGRVLDFGCGSAWAAAWLSQRGFAADALDGSAGLAQQARRRYGIEVRVARFSDFSSTAVYDGVWCSFALLHAARDEIPGHVARLAAALKPGGKLYLGMKAGNGEKRDRLGRRYTYVSAEELRDWAAASGLGVCEIGRETRAGFTGVQEDFLHLYARQAGS
ncbi:MAG: class I SAM-dependent methyltransferase [Pikeienuella sp.]